MALDYACWTECVWGSAGSGSEYISFNHEHDSYLGFPTHLTVQGPRKSRLKQGTCLWISALPSSPSSQTQTSSCPNKSSSLYPPPSVSGSCEAGKTHIQHYQQWCSTGMCALLTALLPVLQQLHHKTHSSASSRTVTSLLTDWRLRLYFLHRLKKFNQPQELLTQLYSAVTEPILCTSITVWFRLPHEH